MICSLRRHWNLIFFLNTKGDLNERCQQALQTREHHLLYSVVVDVGLMWCLIISQTWTPWMSPTQTWLKTPQAGLGTQPPLASLRTKSSRKKLCSGLSARLRATPSMIDDRGAALLKLTRVGSVGWESSPLYLVNIILIISLTNPAVERTNVCICAYTGRGFSMPSVVQVCIMKSWVLFLKPSELQPFSHLRFFSQLPSSPLPSLPPTCTPMEQSTQGYLICSTFKK